MEPAQNVVVYIVDDDAGVREALAWLLRSRRLHSELFDSADAFAQRMLPGRSLDRPCCLLLDVRMPGTSGLDATMVWPLDSKNFKNDWRMSEVETGAGWVMGFKVLSKRVCLGYLARCRVGTEFSSRQSRCLGYQARGL